MSSPVIPNFPPLSSINDPNTRAVLEAVISGLRVRNGEVGDGTEKFLTASDLNAMVTQPSITGNGGALGASLSASGTSWISNLMGRIDDHISQSFLWKKLGEQIKWIDTPEWFMGKFGAAIKTEQIQRQTETSALASTITTVVSNINGNMALVQQELTATSNLAGATATALTQLQTDVSGVRTTAQNALTLATTTEGTVQGAWTVKFDANGYVVGAGLGLEGKNGNYSSAFYVRADAFAVGNPQYPGVAPVIPFKVYPSDTTLSDGTFVKAGTYINEAMVNKINLIGNNSFNVRSQLVGARMEMTNTVIKVFDSAGVLRVKIGDLNA